MQGPQAASATFLRSCNSSKSAFWFTSSHLLFVCVILVTIVHGVINLAIICIESCCLLPYLSASSQAFSTVLRSLVVIFCLTLRPSIVDFILKQYLERADKKPLKLLKILDSYVSNSFLAAIFSRWASSSALNFSASFTWAGNAQMKLSRRQTHHLLYVLFREPALVVGDGDLVLVAGAFVAS